MLISCACKQIVLLLGKSSTHLFRLQLCALGVLVFWWFSTKHRLARDDVLRSVLNSSCAKHSVTKDDQREFIRRGVRCWNPLGMARTLHVGSGPHRWLSLFSLPIHAVVETRLSCCITKLTLITMLTFAVDPSFFFTSFPILSSVVAFGRVIIFTATD